MVVLVSSMTVLTVGVMVERSPAELEWPRVLHTTAMRTWRREVDEAIKPLSEGCSLWAGDYPNTTEGDEKLQAVLKRPAHTAKLARLAAIEEHGGDDDLYGSSSTSSHDRL